jgi:hypothetical protein
VESTQTLNHIGVGLLDDTDVGCQNDEQEHHNGNNDDGSNELRHGFDNLLLGQ